jgi:outer membrane immunogenic protein
VKGWVFGGQAGYNWQVNARMVFGVEADIQATGERANVVGATSFTTPISSDFHLVTTQTTTDDWKFPWFATFRLRGGVLVDPARRRPRPSVRRSRHRARSHPT